jgi:CRP-like cAMP-binding protein
MMIDLDVLERIKVFKDMNDDQLTAIQNHCELVNYQRGDKLFTEGDDATQLWFVADGQVDLRFEMPDDRASASETTISTVDVQDAAARTLGWSCFVPPHKMRLSAYCVSRHCKIVRIEKDALVRIFDKDKDMGYKFMSYIVTVVGYRFHQFQDEVAKHRGEYLMSGW